MPPDRTARPFVSVVVPFFNRQRHIRACIESLLNQEDPGGSYELIFINNRSTDASASIVHEYERLTVLEENTPGAYAARNTGIKQASAPLIAFTDADCRVAGDWLRSIQEGMKHPATAILIGACEYPPEASLALRLLAAYENAKTGYVINHCPPTQHFAHANNMAVRASVLAELGSFQEWERAADSDLVHRLAARRPDLRIAYSPSMRVIHLEFLGARARLRRLALYSHTNARISTFRELGVSNRLHILARLLRRR